MRTQTRGPEQMNCKHNKRACDIIHSSGKLTRKSCCVKLHVLGRAKINLE